MTQKVYIIRHELYNLVEVSQWVTTCSLLGIEYEIISYHAFLQEHERNREQTIIFDTSVRYDLNISGIKGLFCLPAKHILLEDSASEIANIDIVAWKPHHQNIHFRSKLNIDIARGTIKPTNVHNLIASSRYQPIISDFNSSVICSFSIGLSLQKKDINDDYYVMLHFAQNLLEHVLGIEISHKSSARVVFSLDTEGYNETSNRALESVLNCFEQHNIIGIFNLVGKKIEYLESSTLNLISRLRNHYIFCHTYSHSEYPTLAEYLRLADSEEVSHAISRFWENEGKGLELISSHFQNAYTGFTFPGDVFVPFVPIALQNQSKPFLLYTPLRFYGNHKLNGALDLGAATIDLDPYLRGDFSSLISNLVEAWRNTLRGGIGTIVLRIHPDRLLQYGSWDLQKTDPLYDRPDDEVNRIFQNLSKLIEFIYKLPSTEFLNFTKMVSEFNISSPDFNFEQSVTMAQILLDGSPINFIHGQPVSLLDCLYTMCENFRRFNIKGELSETISLRYLEIGPDEFFTCTNEEIPFDALVAISSEIACCYNEDKKLLASYQYNRVTYSLFAILQGFAEVLTASARGQDVADNIKIKKNYLHKAHIDQALMKFVYMWRWPVLSEDFHAPEYVKFARAQFYWTVKPAFPQ